MNLLSKVFCVAVSVLLCAAESAGGATITFESIPGMVPNSPFNNNTPVNLNARLSNQLQSSDGVLFSSEANYVSLVDLGAGHATSGIAGIRGATSGDLIASYRPVIISFWVPGAPTTPATVGSVSMKFDTSPTSGTVTLTAYRYDGSVISTTTVDDSAGLVSMNFSDIHRLQLDQTSFTVAFDDFSYGPLAEVSEAAPEPSTIILAALSLAGLGIFALRKKYRRP